MEILFHCFPFFSLIIVFPRLDTRIHSGLEMSQHPYMGTLAYPWGGGVCSGVWSKRGLPIMFFYYNFSAPSWKCLIFDFRTLQGGGGCQPPPSCAHVCTYSDVSITPLQLSLWLIIMYIVEIGVIINSYLTWNTVS